IRLADNVVASVTKPTTVAELNGIRIAAISGVSCPLTAKLTPHTLYIRDRHRLAITIRRARRASFNAFGNLSILRASRIASLAGVRAALVSLTVIPTSL